MDRAEFAPVSIASGPSEMSAGAYFGPLNSLSFSALVWSACLAAGYGGGSVVQHLSAGADCMVCMVLDGSGAAGGDD